VPWSSSTDRDEPDVHGDRGHRAHLHGCATSWNMSRLFGLRQLVRRLLRCRCVHDDPAGRSSQCSGTVICSGRTVGGLAAMIVAVPVDSWRCGCDATHRRNQIAIFFVFQLSAINFGFTGGTPSPTTLILGWRPLQQAVLYPHSPSWFRQLLSVAVRRSRFGLQLLAIRDDEDRRRGWASKCSR